MTKRIAIAVNAWSANHLDIFALGTDNQLFHKAWDGKAWIPSQTEWEPLGGRLISVPAVAPWRSDRLDIFALGMDNQMLHKAWDGNAWLPSKTEWDNLGGPFTSPPAVASGYASFVDVFALGKENQMLHKVFWKKADAPQWLPTEWENLGGPFTSPPAVAAGGVHRDIFALGWDNQMFHKWLDWKDGFPQWLPSKTEWEPLGGYFTSPPAVASWIESWGPYRLDIFALGTENQMFHKALDNGVWSPLLPHAWGESLGGPFTSPPAVASWGANRVDIFALGTENQMLHKALDNGVWSPSMKEWENLGGVFTRP